MDWLNSVSLSLMNKSLDGTWAQQQAISDNIANYETPGYKRKYVSFEDELKQVLDQTNKKKSQVVNDIKQQKIVLGVADDETSRADGNNVNIDYENIQLARSQLQYRAVSQQLSAHFSRLRSAISSGAK